MTVRQAKINPIEAALAAHDFARDPPFLILGRRKPNGKVDGGIYPIGPEFAKRLQEVAQDAFRQTVTRRMTTYDGATDINPEEGVWVPQNRLRIDAPILKLLREVPEDEFLSSEQATDLPLSFYAIAYGVDGERVFFIREKASHIRGKGKIFGMIDGPMRLVTSPMLSLDTYVDMIVADAGAAVFNGHSFERFIQDPVEIKGQFDESVEAIANQVPFHADTIGMMKQKGELSLLMRGRVRSILDRPYFGTLTIPLIRSALKAKGLDPAHFIVGKELKFDAGNTIIMLKLLDQKLWNGDFDGKLYSTNSASPEDL